MKYEQMAKSPSEEIQQGSAPPVGQEVEVSASAPEVKSQRSPESTKAKATVSDVKKVEEKISRVDGTSDL